MGRLSVDAVLQPRATRAILVVEDEVLIRFDIADALREKGYIVFEAASGDEALDLLSSGIACDLVFSDVRMPGMVDGLELARIVRTRYPNLPVLLTSGHLPKHEAVNATVFVPKPYRHADLFYLIADLLHQQT